ncbi:MAG: FHA domain-containing protein [Anaerolineae bacterium]|nr:FHA domain-containing protein [Anaerolineae bacterium]
MAKLVIFEAVEGADTIFEDFELLTNNILIGSGPDNHLVLDSPEVDPTHASLELRNNDWVLQDLGSPGGTLVNNNAIKGPYRLKHNDLIELGGIQMRFTAEALALEAEEGTSTTEDVGDDGGEHISGRVWFATLVGGTLAVIFIVLFLLIVADVLGVLKITDLLPWLGWLYPPA